jgi:hypothetical protein
MTDAQRPKDDVVLGLEAVVGDGAEPVIAPARSELVI